MAKLELKGYILTVNKPETVGEKNTPKQKIIFKVPGYTDQFGDKIGTDEEWPLDIMGDNVEKLKIGIDAQGKKAKVGIFLNGTKYTRKDDGVEGWMINARVNTLDLIDTNPTTSNTNNSTPSGW